MASQDPIDAKFEALESRLESLGGQTARFVSGVQNWTTTESNKISASREFREAPVVGGLASATHEGRLPTLGRRPSGVDFARRTSQPSFTAKKIDKRRTTRQIGKGSLLTSQRTMELRPSLQKGRLLLIEPIEDMKEVQEHEEEVADEEQQPIDITMHALNGYANP
ncbi:hypothetical protein BHE74_00037341 [Ensete ventricosum]|nr:hypothetical protein GW17_00058199 [Ensete ventricosum]RWW55971.1 hypothetical protein BHE74_00037341 [Ensete ventricosum]RZR99398.1 hypothetical protein BHM03_00028922 [Ensete ventricosum]